MPAGVTFSALAGSLQADNGQYRRYRTAAFAVGSASATPRWQCARRLRCGTADLSGCRGGHCGAAAGRRQSGRYPPSGRRPGGAVQLAAHASARPFAPTLVQQLPRAQIHASGIDLRQWLADAPASDAQLELDIHPRTAGLCCLDSSCNNQLGGRIDDGWLPLRSARGEARLTAEQLQLRELDVELPRGRLAAWAMPVQWRWICSCDWPTSMLAPCMVGCCQPAWLDNCI